LGTDYFVEHGGQITIQAPDQNVTQYSAIANGSLQSTMQYYLNERRKLGISTDGLWRIFPAMLWDIGRASNQRRKAVEP
jgi:hypothetical protein